MSRVPQLTSATIANASAQWRERRRRRLTRDLLALRTMQGTVHRGQIICAVVVIPLLALLWFIAIFQLHPLTGSPIVTLALSLGLGALVWAIGRRWLTFVWMIVVALLILLFEDAPVDFINFGDDKDARRRAKLSHAIAKREALLRGLEGDAP